MNAVWKWSQAGPLTVWLLSLCYALKDGWKRLPASVHCAPEHNRAAECQCQDVLTQTNDSGLFPLLVWWPHKSRNRVSLWQLKGHREHCWGSPGCFLFCYWSAFCCWRVGGGVGGRYQGTVVGRRSATTNQYEKNRWIDFQLNTPAAGLVMTLRVVIQGVGHENALTGLGAMIKSQPGCPSLTLRSHSSEIFGRAINLNLSSWRAVSSSPSPSEMIITLPQFDKEDNVGSFSPGDI